MMELVMKVNDVVSWVRSAHERDLSMKTICVREPWTPEAEARVVAVDEQSRLPTDALADGYKYFLEASLAREVLEVLHDRPSPSSAEDACKLLIHYAENDAYPEWVYR
jgi:hypothetical protein